MLFTEATFPNGHHQRYLFTLKCLNREDLSDILLDNFPNIPKGHDHEKGNLWRRGYCRCSLVTALCCVKLTVSCQTQVLCWLALPSQVWNGRGGGTPSCSQHHLPPASATKLSANFQLQNLNFQGGLGGEGEAVLD